MTKAISARGRTLQAGDAVRLAEYYLHGQAGNGTGNPYENDSAVHLRPGQVGKVRQYGVDPADVVDYAGDICVEINEDLYRWAKPYTLVHADIDDEQDGPEQGSAAVNPIDDPAYTVFGSKTLRAIADMLALVEEQESGVTFFESPITVVTDGMRLGYLQRFDDFWHFVPDPKETA